MKSQSGFFQLLYFTLIISSCSPFKNMKGGEKLFYKQSIKGNKEISKSDLKTNYQLIPNRNLFSLFPSISIYNLGYSIFDSSKIEDDIKKTSERFKSRIEKTNDTIKKDRLAEKKDNRLSKLEKKLNEGNWIMRMGAAPVVFDTSKINLTKKLIAHEAFSDGFFHSKVETEIDSSHRKVAVTYRITEGIPSINGEITNTIPDKKIHKIVNNSNADSYLKTAKRYNEENLQNELNRLTRLLRDYGYYDFESQYIYFNVDTTKQRDTVKIQVVIKNPKGKIEHKIYNISSILFITDENKIDSNVIYDTLYYDGIKYVFNKNDHYSTKIIDRKLKIRNGQTYSQTNVEKTQRNLNYVDIFRTANIKFSRDTINHLLNARVYTYTLPHYVINGQTGFNINQSTVPGPFGSLNYKHRNSLNRLGLFEFNARASIAAQAAILEPTNILRTEEYLGQISLAFPQLFLPFFRNLKWEDNDPETKGNLGFTIVNRNEYQRNAAQTGIIYSINPDQYTSIIFSPIDVNLINTVRLSAPFEEYLIALQQQGNNLIESFRNSYVSDINFSYISNNYNFQSNTKAHYIKYYFESGGTFLNLLPKESLFGLETFRYLKFNTEYRFYIPIRANRFAMRYNIGAAYPYSKNQTLPYEKYFFAGGPNSLRAWRLRRLGPGSYAPIDSATGKINDNIEAPGEFILESNFEYRFKIAGFFEGATFIDIGNVWILRKDAAQPGAQLKIKDLFSQIAVGTGIGLRLNFSFLLVRFDLGIKAYDPAKQKFVLFNGALKESILNFGIGYPF